MATSTEPDRRQVADHHAAQVGLGVVVAHELRSAVSSMRLRTPQEAQAAFPQLVQLVQAVTRRHGSAASTLAVRRYGQVRRAAGVRTSFTPRPADPAPLPQVQALVGWATKPLTSPETPAVAPQTLTPGTSPTVTSETATEAAQQTLEDRLIVGTERLVLNQGRETTVENVQRDRQARAWAREVRPGCCAFCALMASRGPAYRSQDTAGGNANIRFTGGGKFKFHNNCYCDVVPVFGAYEMTATAREAEAIYKNRGQGDALNAFRRAWEDRNRPDGFTPRIPR